MKTYQQAAAGMFLAAMSALAVAQTACLPPPTGVSPLPPPPPGTTWCATRSVAPAATPFSASQGLGYEHADANGKKEIAEHFTMTGTIEGDVLNVTSITGGHIHIGQVFTGQGLPANGIEITEFVSGNFGGVGKYHVKTR